MKRPMLEQFRALNEIKIAMQEVSRLVEKHHMRGNIGFENYRVLNVDCEDFLNKVRIRMDYISPDLIEENKQ